MSITPVRSIETPSTSFQDLDRLLKRLEQTILHDDGALRSSQYTRRKIGANVEYARTLLLRLEHDTTAIKIQSRRTSLSNDLKTKRELIKQLNRRLLELDELDDVDSSSDEEDEDDGESNGLREFAPARQDTRNSIDTNPAPTPSDNTVDGLRSRKPQTMSPNTASTTALFEGRSQQNTSSSLPQTEKLLSHNRTEQEAITSGLISLAQQLKQSSVKFAQSLESEKDVVNRAEGGLDKNALGMEAAERRMGTLRRMTEGQGWLGRMKLYAIIFGLWVAAFLLVFVGPKFRF